MKKQIRLDKFLCEVSGASRSEVKIWLKKNRVKVNGAPEKDPGRKVSPDEDKVMLDGNLLSHQEYHYVMLHKPSGLVSATQDANDKTVVDLVLEQDWTQGPAGTSYGDIFPVGRLDKDTEGLLVLTDDGDLAHQLLSPKKHVDKCYFALLDGSVGEEEVTAFEEGLDIGDDKKTLPAKLRIASPEESLEQAGADRAGFGVFITIQEGRFHQVKRMAKAVGREVIYLKRISMGDLKLDPTLQKGASRPLTEEEYKILSGR